MAVTILSPLSRTKGGEWNTSARAKVHTLVPEGKSDRAIFKLTDIPWSTVQHIRKGKSSRRSQKNRLYRPRITTAREICQVIYHISRNYLTCHLSYSQVKAQLEIQASADKNSDNMIITNIVNCRIGLPIWMKASTKTCMRTSTKLHLNCFTLSAIIFSCYEISLIELSALAILASFAISSMVAYIASPTDHILRDSSWDHSDPSNYSILLLLLLARF